jgi:flavin-dependent dehydrogenase
VSRARAAAPALGCDVLVAGAGPAGSACALLLAREGIDVLLVDKAAFPRHKLCGDFLTPGSVAALEELGAAADAAEGRPVPLRGMRLTLDGIEVRLPFPEATRGWGIGRRSLDAALLGAARRAGARVLTGTRLHSLSDAGGAVEASGRGPDGAPVAVEARFAVDASGRHGIAARGPGWRRAPAWPVRYAVGAWFEAVRGLADHGEMHVLGGRPEGYVGVSPLGPDLASVAAVVGPRVFAAWRRDLAGLLARILAAHRELGARFAAARRVTAARGAGPLARGSRPFGAGRIALAGDAAAFVDPFTGDGVHHALTGGILAARAAAAFVRDGDAGAAERHAESLRRALAPRFAVARALQAALALRPAARRAAAALAAREELAGAVVAVTGGVGHPRTLLAPAFWAPLMIGILAAREAAP